MHRAPSARGEGLWHLETWQSAPEWGGGGACAPLRASLQIVLAKRFSPHLKTIWGPNRFGKGPNQAIAKTFCKTFWALFQNDLGPKSFSGGGQNVFSFCQNDLQGRPEGGACPPPTHSGALCRVPRCHRPSPHARTARDALRARWGGFRRGVGHYALPLVVSEPLGGPQLKN